MQAAIQTAKIKPTGRPRKPEVEARILDVTMQLMCEEGFSRMSIDGIAVAAGVSKPTIYRRWSGKADIATAALERLRLAEPSVEGKHGLDKVRALLFNFRKSLLRPNGMALIGVVLTEERHNPELMKHFRERIVKPRREMVATALEEARAMGEIQKHADIDAMVTMLIGSFYGRYLSGASIPPGWIIRIVDALVCKG